MTAVLDFVEDPVSRHISGSGGIEDSVLNGLHRLRPRVCLVRRVCDFGTKSREEREKCNGIVYTYHFYSLAVEAGFYGDTGRVMAFLRS